ncbi:MAG: type IV toxin-antitoxin system AbiEi family antitoxin domain-containing protein [Actinobacteria bacterium]|nr:type IV toxin-antitoxin system AbiEi family antitoxin domain-containing protein [Actinomycetota bacterium]
MRSHQALAELAARQHGVVSFRQLRELGFSKGKISRSFEAFRLRRIHRGVYAVGHDRLGDRGRCMAAVLACDVDALISHGSAAWLWGLLPRCPADIEVTTITRRRHRVGIRVHRAAEPGSEWGRIDNIPVTALPQTLFDVAATRSAHDLTTAIDGARRRDLLDLVQIDALLERRPRAPGSGQLREAIRLYRDPAFDRARSELMFLDLVKKAGLPRPALNTWVDEWEIDAYWEAERFAVEVDGWEAHGTRSAFEADRLRTENMKLTGIDVVRVTARRIERHPREVASRLRVHLERRRHEHSL